MGSFTVLLIFILGRLGVIHCSQGPSNSFPDPRLPDLVVNFEEPVEEGQVILALFHIFGDDSLVELEEDLDGPGHRSEI